MESEQSSLFYKIARDDSMLVTESKDKFDLVNRVRRRAKLKKTTKREWRFYNLARRIKAKFKAMHYATSFKEVEEVCP